MGGNGKILIIDDEEDLRENLKYVFEKKGYQVELAEDGVQGLKKLESFQPDLIILDLNMPNMGGIEFYEKICDGDVPRYPVFVLTARVNMEKFFKDFNVDGFMAKPFEIPDLLAEVSIVIEKKKGNFKDNTKKSGELKKIFLVEDNETFSAKVGAAFLMKGFTVDLAKSGTEALERISKDVPDVACVKMRLADIPGEFVVMKLKRLAKTSGVKTILYSDELGEEKTIMDNIVQHKSIDKFVLVTSEQDLVHAVGALQNI
jgi:DNA-binding response OmpR family regulator